LKSARRLEFSTRIAVLSLFGMMNWIYTWHNPRADADSEAIAREMGDIFLRGVMNRDRSVAPPYDAKLPRPARNDIRNRPN
jgi:hypothetical protein